MIESPFRQRPADWIVGIGASHLPIKEVGDLTRHRRMEADALLDDRETFSSRLHLPHVGGVILWRLAAEREPDAAVVDANPIANFSSKQFVDGYSRGFPRDVPERHLDGADGTAPG